MADTRASVLLDAAQCAADADLDRFAELIARHQDWLRLEVVLRVLLTYLPESVEPSLYLSVLRTLATWDANPAQQDLGQGPPATGEEGSRQKLHLLALPIEGGEADDIFVRFLFVRAHRIDTETGLLGHVRDLIEPFAGRSDALRTWLAATIRPLLRLDYEYYPDLTPTYTLESFERLRGRSGVYALLFELLRRNKDEDGGNYGRDFRGVLAPWVTGQALKMGQMNRKDVMPANGEDEDDDEDSPLATLWSDVFSALLDYAVEHHSSVVSLIQDWSGPQDSELDDADTVPIIESPSACAKYVQMMLALLYLEAEGSGKLSTEQESIVLQRAARLRGMTLLVDPRNINLASSAASFVGEPIDTISPLHLLHGELLESSNPLTHPTTFTVQLGAFLASSKSLMASLEDSLPLQAVTSLCLFGHTVDQRTRIQKILHGLASHSAIGDSFWRDARKKLLWLRQWNLVAEEDESHRVGVFCRVGLRETEISVLRTLAGTGNFKLLAELYINTNDNLPSNVVEQVLVEVAMSAYDNATNGNKTRGGMKRASDIIATFRHQFAKSTRFQQAHALIQATHALSFYTLTLQHGNPFLPANLRIHPNPVSLFDKVLEQNPQSYTKLEDLIEIGRNFVRAGLTLPYSDEPESTTDPKERALAQIERVVTAKAIGASLAEKDFDTAYSYVVNRLSASSSDQSGDEHGDDLLWRAAYQAGRHQSIVNDEQSKLRRIEQRMELLSQAVLIAPPAALQDVLETWRSCEEEFNACRSQAAEEEEQWNSKGDQTIPGGFTADSIPLPQKARESTRRAVQEEAPMGLFDVARGAAAAFSKSAFTPGSPAGRSGPPSTHLASPQSPDSADGDSARVRKRDMVSSAVTGGLVSGIGWVLGTNAQAEQ